MGIEILKEVRDTEVIMSKEYRILAITGKEGVKTQSKSLRIKFDKEYTATQVIALIERLIVDHNGGGDIGESKSE